MTLTDYYLTFQSLRLSSPLPIFREERNKNPTSKREEHGRATWSNHWPLIATLTSIRHGHHPTKHSRAPRDRRSILAGSRVATRLQGVQTKGSGWAHRQISSTHVWTSCLHPRNTAVPDRDACGRRSTQRPEGVSTGARGAGLRVGKPGGRGAGTPASGPASKCLPASRAAAPAAGGPLLPETCGAPRPCQDPDSPRGARTQCDLAGRETWR